MAEAHQQHHNMKCRWGTTKQSHAGRQIKMQKSASEGRYTLTLLHSVSQMQQTPRLRLYKAHERVSPFFTQGTRAHFRLEHQLAIYS